MSYDNDSGEETTQQLSQDVLSAAVNNSSQASTASIEVTPKKNALKFESPELSPGVKRYRTPRKCKDCAGEFLNSVT